jgi:hypothetical protein
VLQGAHLLECGANERVQAIRVAVVSLVIMLGISGDYFRAAAGKGGDDWITRSLRRVSAQPPLPVMSGK